MRPVWKWVIGILALIVVALVALSLYFSANWNPLVEKKLKELVKNSTDSLYSLSYDNLDISLALGNLTVKNAILKADTQVYAQMEAVGTAPDNLYQIELGELKVKRFNLLSVLLKKNLEVKSIALTDTRIHLQNKYHSYNDTTTVDRPKKDIYESVKEIFNSVKIAQIDVDDAGFIYTKIEDGDTTDFNLAHVHISVKDILLDESSRADSSRLYYTKQIDVMVPAFEYEFANGYYKTTFDTLKINTYEQTLLLTNVNYTPTLSKAAFYKKQGKNVTRADLHFDTLYMQGLDFRRLIENQQTVAQRVWVKNGYAKLYGDKRYPKNPVNQVGQAPHQKLMRVKKLVHLDSVFVENIDVVYGEMSPKYFREGEISFNSATGVLTNVTNDTVSLSRDQFMQADLQAKIMNRGQLQVRFGFDMLSKNGAHSYKGTLGKMDATVFNRILYPLLNVEIASGNIRSIRFDIKGTDYQSRGDFRFDYGNLKIDLKASPDQPKKKSSLKIASFLVNTLIINDSNPDANEVYHIGKVNHRRDPEHTFFKNLWQSLLDGIKQTAGISKEREGKWTERAEVAKEAVQRTKKTKQQTKGFFKGLFKKKENSTTED